MSLLLAVLVALPPGLPAREVSVARLEAAGLDVAGAFSDDELAGLASGLDALPVALRRVPSGRLRLVLDASLPTSVAGIAEPEFRGDDFVLTRQAGHASFRDAALDDAARLKLWRARAVVHALLSRWDDVRRWSVEPIWRRGNGWLLPFERPLAFTERSLNQASTAFARPRGRVSSKLDLLTFAESALVPVEQLPTDDLVRCQEFTRLRALGELLGTGWQPGACPAFERWVRLDDLEHLEVLLVQSSSRAPESLFGHLLVRPVWRTTQGPSFDSAVQFTAITPTIVGAEYIASGLFGGYSMGVFTISMTDLGREKLSGEQRSMTRWKLALTPGEQRRFLERAWEFERRGRFTYAFFSDNCATVLVWMLESSLQEPVLPRWPAFITAPNGVLDDLFRAKRKDGRRLLSPVFPSFEATGVVAQREEARRRELEPGLAALGVDFSGAHSRDVATRRATYRELARASEEAPVALQSALFIWWAASARVERAPTDQAQHALRELDIQRLERKVDDLEALWVSRLRILERESTLQKQLMLLDRDAFFDEVRRGAKKRDLTAAEAEATAEWEAQLALFDEVTTAQGSVGEEAISAPAAQAFLAREAAAALQAEVGAAEGSLPISGLYRSSLGGGVWRRGDGSTTPVVTLHEAGLQELLGEQRLRGIGAPAGVRILEGGVTFATARQVPEVVQSNFTLLAFDSIAAPLPPSPRWREHLGYGFEVGSDYRAWRSQPSLAGATGWVMLGVHGDHARNLLAVGVGPSGWVATDPTGLMPVGGVTTRLVARVGLQAQGPSGLRLEARHQSVWGPGRELHELRADLALEWVLAWGGRARLLVRPTVGVTAEPALARLNAVGQVMLEAVESLADLRRP